MKSLMNLKLSHFIMGSFVIVLIIPRIINFPQMNELLDEDPYPSPSDKASFADEMNDLTITKKYLPIIPKGPPIFSKSWYVKTVDTQFWFGKGCEKGEEDRFITGKQDSVVILDFNFPTLTNGVYGAKLFSGGPASTSAIAAAVEFFGFGYYTCVQPDTTSTVVIAVGTNNCNQAICPGSISGDQYDDHGTSWAEMVNDIGTYFINHGQYPQVRAYGASDMEVGWNDAYTTKQWVDGYSSSNNWPMLNFGDAAGCPEFRTYTNAPCSNGWYQYTIWYISGRGGLNSSRPLPQIYDNGGRLARQWYSLSAYGYDMQNGRLDIQGALTQSEACSQVGCDPDLDNMPGHGYYQLQACLINDPVTLQFLKWSTDIGYSGY